MSLKIHDPPALLDDLKQENLAGWSQIISDYMSELTDETQFYDATQQKESGKIAVKKITWTAFPRKVQIAYGDDRYKVADSDRKYQDEYCEWSVEKDSTGKIIKIVFCNEGPEYWSYIGEKQPDTLVDLYQKLHPDVNIDKSKLFDGDGNYLPHNEYNNSTKGGTIAHLIQRANTLGAEIILAGQATVIRKDPSGDLVTSPDRLIKCSQYGDPDRFSDPTIGAQVNDLARSGVMITVNNPVGLYIDSVDLDDFEAPDGADVSQFWTWQRGNPYTDNLGNNFKYHTRATFEVPKDKNYVLGDLKISGKTLDYGSQVADKIRIALYGRAYDLDNPVHAAEPQPCLSNSDSASNTLATGQNGSAKHKLTRHRG